VYYVAARGSDNRTITPQLKIKGKRHYNCEFKRINNLIVYSNIICICIFFLTYCFLGVPRPNNRKKMRVVTYRDWNSRGTNNKITIYYLLTRVDCYGIFRGTFTRGRMYRISYTPFTTYRYCSAVHAIFYRTSVSCTEIKFSPKYSSLNFSG